MYVYINHYKTALTLKLPLPVPLLPPLSSLYHHFFPMSLPCSVIQLKAVLPWILAKAESEITAAIHSS